MDIWSRKYNDLTYLKQKHLSAPAWSVLSEIDRLFFDSLKSRTPSTREGARNTVGRERNHLTHVVGVGEETRRQHGLGWEIFEKKRR